MQSISLSQGNSHFNLWPILFLVVCIIDIKLCKLFLCFGDEYLVDIFFGKHFPYSEDCPCLSWGFALGLQMLLIQSQYLICGLFFIILRDGSIKTWCILCKIVSCLYFLKDFIVSIITFRYLYSLGFILCLVLGCFLISFSFSWLKESSQCPPEWLFPIYIPSIGGGGIPCLHTFSALIVCRVFGNGHSEQCDVILHCSLELHFTNV